MEWVASITTTAIFTTILWMLRNTIALYLTNSVKHEYDKKLEDFKSSLREKEQSLKESIDEKTREIESLRNTALAGIINSHAELYKHRVTAVEKMWKAVVELAPAKAVSQMMAHLKIDVLEKKSSTEKEKIETLMTMIETASGNFDIKKLSKGDVHLIRPFVSPLAWSLYSTYFAIISRSCLQLHFLKNDMETKYIDSKNLKKLIEIALPHQKEFIEKFGLDASYHLLEELEPLLLKELDSILRGEAYDEEKVDRSCKINRYVQKVVEENTSIVS